MPLTCRRGDWNSVPIPQYAETNIRNLLVSANQPRWRLAVVRGCVLARGRLARPLVDGRPGGVAGGRRSARGVTRRYSLPGSDGLSPCQDVSRYPAARREPCRGAAPAASGVTTGVRTPLHPAGSVLLSYLRVSVQVRRSSWQVTTTRLEGEILLALFRAVKRVLKP